MLAFLAAAIVGSPSAWAQRQPGARTVVIEDGAQSGYLGIGVADITSERAKALNLKEERGAEVTSVEPDSPAAKAGLQKGDVVVEYNGQAVQGTAQLTRLVRETPPGRQVHISALRNGSTQKLTATLEPRKSLTFQFPQGMRNLAIPRVPQMDVPQFQMAWRSPLLGIVGEALGEQPQLADFFGVKDGVLVKSVTKGSAAEKAGLKAGDVVVKVDDSHVTSAEEIRKALASLRDQKRTFTVTVVRGKKEMPLQVTLESQTGGVWPAHTILFTQNS